MSRCSNSQRPTPNAQVTPNAQLPRIGSWALGVYWALGVGSWELGIEPGAEHATIRAHNWRSPMKKTLFALLGVVSVTVAAAAQAPKAPTPGPEHKRLGFFVGKWNTVGEIKDSPMGPGGKVTSTDSCAWFEGGFSVVCHYEGKSPMGPSK